MSTYTQAHNADLTVRRLFVIVNRTHVTLAIQQIMTSLTPFAATSTGRQHFKTLMTISHRLTLSWDCVKIISCLAS